MITRWEKVLNLRTKSVNLVCTMYILVGWNVLMTFIGIVESRKILIYMYTFIEYIVAAYDVNCII